MSSAKDISLSLLNNAIANAKSDLLVLLHIGNTSDLYSLFCWHPNGKYRLDFLKPTSRQIELIGSLLRELKAAAL